MILETVALEILDGIELAVRGVHFAEWFGAGKAELSQPTVLLPVSPKRPAQIVTGFGEIEVAAQAVRPDLRQQAFPGLNYFQRIKFAGLDADQSQGRVGTYFQVWHIF